MGPERIREKFESQKEPDFRSAHVSLGYRSLNVVSCLSELNLGCYALVTDEWKEVGSES